MPDVTISLTNQILTLSYTTEDGYTGILTVPTDPFSTDAYECVIYKSETLHEAAFPRTRLGEHNYQVYIQSMTLSARRDSRKVS